MSGNIQPSVSASEHIGFPGDGENIDAKRVASYETIDGIHWNRAGMPTTTRLDDTTTTDTTYIGKASIGSNTSEEAWQIAKLDTSSGLVKTWADGDALFNNIWDDRASLTYQ
jgi:hypothetical protein